MPCPILNMAAKADFSLLTDRLDARLAPGDSVESTVNAIIEAIAQQGDAALVEYTKRFDCPGFHAGQLNVPPADIEAARQTLDPKDLAIIEEAAANIRRFHEAQRERSWWMDGVDGTVLGQLVRPVDRVGLYVPGGMGGETPLISSLLMNAIPAQVAGVESIAVVSPPRADGSLNPNILAAAAVLGITEVHPVGSAWAVAALALGTPSIKAVDVIAGPGNIYVATAKRILSGRVGIDMLAGPSEIVILADASANAAWLAADMLSQAEHDPLAASVAIVPNQDMAQKLQVELQVQLAALPRSEMAGKALSAYGGIVVCPDEALALELVNRLAPEHLELCVDDPMPLLGRIRHAGAIFCGHNCPEPVGDYFAGPNHVLPTHGTARFSSALSVSTFTKKSSVLLTSQAYLQAHGAKIARLARLEGLEAHARSAEVRFLGR